MSFIFTKNMKDIFYSFILIAGLLSCVKQGHIDPNINKNTSKGKPWQNPNDTIPMTPIKYLALGDSYTFGESVKVGSRFPDLLLDELKNAGYNIEDLQLIARTGWTTGELQNAINVQQPDTTFGLVTLLIGVNNQYRSYDLDEYKTEFEALLKQAIHFAGGKTNRVFVVSIPDYGYTPFGEATQEKISRELEQFNKANREITLRSGITYFDITPISQNGLKDVSLIADDGLHPSGKMYAQWVELMKHQVISQLKK